MLINIRKIAVIAFLAMIFCYFHALNAQDIPEDSNNANMLEEELPDLGNIPNSNDAQNATEEKQDAKIVKLEMLTNLNDLQNMTIYKGQYLKISYKVLLFNNAKIVYTEFSPSIKKIDFGVQSLDDKDSSKNAKNSKKNKSNVELVDISQWKAQSDGTFTAEATFKVNAVQFSIPSLVVHVKNEFLQDVDQTDSLSLMAQDLSGNSAFCSVIASSFDIINSSVEKLDDNYNTITLEVQAKNSNLQDLSIKNVDVEFDQDSNFNKDISSATINVKVPKTMDNLTFNYFNIDKKSFQPVTIHNIVHTIDEDIKTNITPKDTFFTATNITIIVIIALLLIIMIIKKSYLSGTLAIVLVVFWAYSIFSRSYTITTMPNAKLTIQPTITSTVLLVLPNPIKLKAIDKKNGYYKVNINSKTGWINTNDTK